jgi:hypothetical protein
MEASSGPKSESRDSPRSRRSASAPHRATRASRNRHDFAGRPGQNAQVHDELDQDEINKLLSRILRGSKRVKRTSDDWMVPVGMPRFKGPGDAGAAVFYGLDRESDLEVDHAAQENLRVLAHLLQGQLKSPEQANAHYVEREIMAAVGDVKSGTAKAKGLGQSRARSRSDLPARSRSCQSEVSTSRAWRRWPSSCSRPSRRLCVLAQCVHQAHGLVERSSDAELPEHVWGSSCSSTKTRSHSSRGLS